MQKRIRVKQKELSKARRRRQQKAFFMSVLIVIALLLCAWVVAKEVNSAINKHEKMECLTWLDQYPVSEWTSWQKAQCKHHGFIK